MCDSKPKNIITHCGTGHVCAANIPGVPSFYIPINVSYIPNMGGWNITNVIPEAPKSVKKDDRDGCDCIKCKNFYPYAEPNQKDGTLICYGCRMEW